MCPVLLGFNNVSLPFSAVMAATKLLLLLSPHCVHSPTRWTFSDVLSFCFKLLFLLWDGIPKVGANIPTWNLNFLVLFHFLNITVCFFSLISWLGFSPVTAKTFGDNLAVSVGFAGHLLSLLHPH